MGGKMVEVSSDSKDLDSLNNASIIRGECK